MLCYNHNYDHIFFYLYDTLNEAGLIHLKSECKLQH